MDGFIQRICEDPYDIGSRLIYADYLEDRDPVRAEFIRIQIELAEYEPYKQKCECLRELPEKRPCPYCRLRRRERQIIGVSPVNRWLTWFHPVAGLGPNFQWKPQRGFVEQVACTCTVWLEHGPIIVRCQPVVVVWLTDWEQRRNVYGPLLIDPDWLKNPIAWARGAHPAHGLAAVPPLKE